MPARPGWRLLAASLRQRRRALFRLAAWSAIEAAPALLSGVSVAAALDEGFLAGRPWVGLGWLGLYGAALTAKAAATNRMFRPLADTVEPLRDDLVRHVVAGALDRAISSEARPDTAGVARLTEQVQPVRGIVAVALLSVRQFAVALVAALAGVALLAPAALAVVLPPVVLSLALFSWLLPSLGRRKRAVLLAKEAIGRAVGPVLIGMRDVVAAGAADRAAAAVGRTVDAEAAAERAYGRSEALRLLVCALGGQGPVVALLLAAPWLRRGGGLSAGEVVGAVTYVATSVNTALASCMAMVATYGVQLAVTLDRLAESGPAPQPPAARAAGSPAGYQLVTERLSFAYGQGAEPIVNDLSIVVPEGGHLAIVGPSGIGKSTLASLLTGLVAPDRGQVRLGGMPLDRIGEEQLRHVMALIPQEAYVFAGTLRENLTYLTPDATEAELDRAVDAVGLRPVVRRSGGLDAMLGPDAVSLSAGERQLVALTRVYLSPARVVILDEGTCHLDPAAEATAEGAFAARPGTLIVIAHRITSALRANRILVMDGRRAVLGTHAELVADSELYRTLVGHWTDPQPVAA
jgi:ABC-type multidrug transport system fused ATPase/permease subunit